MNYKSIPIELTFNSTMPLGDLGYTLAGFDFSRDPVGIIEFGLRTLLSTSDMVDPGILFRHFELANNLLYFQLHGCRYATKVEVYRIYPEEEFVNMKTTSSIRSFFKNENMLKSNNLVKTFTNLQCYWDNKEYHTVNGVIDLTKQPNVNTLLKTDFNYNFSTQFLEFVQTELAEVLNDSNIIMFKAYVDTQRSNVEDDALLSNLNNRYLHDSENYKSKENHNNNNNDSNTKKKEHPRQTSEDDAVSTENNDNKDITDNSNTNAENSTASYNITNNSTNSTTTPNETRNTTENSEGFLSSNSTETNTTNEEETEENKPDIDFSVLNFDDDYFKEQFIKYHSLETNLRMVPKFHFQSKNVIYDGDDKVISHPVLVNKNGSYVIDDIDSMLFKPIDLQAMFVLDDGYRFTTDTNNGSYYLYPFFEIVYEHQGFKTSQWKFDLKLNVAIYGNSTGDVTPKVQIYAKREDIISPPQLKNMDFTAVRMNILSDLSYNHSTIENDLNFSSLKENLCKIYDVEELNIGSMVRFVTCQIFDGPITYDYIKTYLLSAYIHINLNDGDDNNGALKGVIALNNPEMRGKLITSDAFCLSSFYKFITKYDSKNQRSDGQYYDISDTEDDYYIDFRKVSNFVWSI